MHFRRDPEKHGELVKELAELFIARGFRIVGADGLAGYPGALRLHNDGYGDQEDKAPDILAFDDKRHCSIIGEAKTGDGDFETEHALTQYNVFLDQFDKSSTLQADVYIIVPVSKVPEFTSLITHYIHPDYLESVIVVGSEVTEA
jgi:hypothetical protein